jgi:hypothetical protein
VGRDSGNVILHQNVSISYRDLPPARYASCQPGGSRGSAEPSLSSVSLFASQGNACSSFSQRPRSISRQRSLQNGKYLFVTPGSANISHVGHLGRKTSLSAIVTPFSLHYKNHRRRLKPRQKLPSNRIKRVTISFSHLATKPIYARVGYTITRLRTSRRWRLPLAHRWESARRLSVAGDWPSSRKWRTTRPRAEKPTPDRLPIPRRSPHGPMENYVVEHPNNSPRPRRALDRLNHAPRH